MLTPHVLLCTDRIGYGHIRGMLAVEDALQRIGIPTESVFASRVSSWLYRLAWGVLDHGLGVPYKLFPERYSRMQPDTSVQGMQLINTWMRRLDGGTFARYARGTGTMLSSLRM